MYVGGATTPRPRIRTSFMNIESLFVRSCHVAIIAIDSQRDATAYDNTILQQNATLYRPFPDCTFYCIYENF